MKQRIIIALCLLIVTLLTVQALYAARKPVAVKHAAAAIIDPNAYPAVTAEEWGQLRWMLKLADQDIPNFTNFQSVDEQGVSASRYSIAFGAYFLAAEQYHKVPAWQETIKTAFDRINQKMLDKQVWGYWANESLGITKFEPNMDRPYAENKDPVSLGNIMYSGHLGHMIASYEMLYRDLKWSEPGSIVFKWSDDETHVYDNNSLQKAMYNQMTNNPHKSIECEPNAVFPECNQHPILSFMLYDHVHGTNYGEARNAFMNFFLLSRMISPITHETCLFYLVKQKTTLSQEFASFGNGLSLLSVPLAWLGVLNVRTSVANGWNGTFMHTWQPEFIERHYEFQKKRHIIETDSNTAYLKTEMILDQIATPFFAMLASEVGDLELRDKLVAWCKDYYKPVSVNGMLSYPVKEPVTLINPNKGFTPTSQALTGILIAYAMANTKDGQRMVIQKPFTEKNFNAPKVSGIDFPNVLLNRAIYDFEKESLVITVSGGALKTGNTVFNVIQLDPARQWALTIDGQLINRFTDVSSIPVEISLDKAHDIVLVAE